MRSYWSFKALLEMAREEPYQLLSNKVPENREALGAMDLAEKEEGVKEDNGAVSKQSKMRRLIGVSLW